VLSLRFQIPTVENYLQLRGLVQPVLSPNRANPNLSGLACSQALGIKRYTMRCWRRLRRGTNRLKASNKIEKEQISAESAHEITATTSGIMIGSLKTFRVPIVPMASTK
jgi:hypothetical protein